MPCHQALLLRRCLLTSEQVECNFDPPMDSSAAKGQAATRTAILASLPGSLWTFYPVLLSLVIF